MRCSGRSLGMLAPYSMRTALRQIRHVDHFLDFAFSLGPDFADFEADDLHQLLLVAAQRIAICRTTSASGPAPTATYRTSTARAMTF
jgi:hypothetical protein